MLCRSAFQFNRLERRRPNAYSPRFNPESGGETWLKVRLLLTN